MKKLKNSHYQIVRYNKGCLEDIEIQVEVYPRIKLVEPFSVERSPGQAKRILDMRKR